MLHEKRDQYDNQLGISTSAGLVEVLLTGGLPPGIDEPCAAHNAYRSLFPKVMRQNGRSGSRRSSCSNPAQSQRCVHATRVSILLLYADATFCRRKRTAA